MKHLFALLFISTLLVNCGSSTKGGVDEATYGKAWDTERAKLGIPAMDAEMGVSNDGVADQLHWINTDMGMNDIRNKPTHDEKFMHFANGKPVSEKDIYSSHAAGDKETLEIEYHYDKPDAAWTCTYTLGSKTETYTLTQADALLAQWEMKR